IEPPAGPVRCAEVRRQMRTWTGTCATRCAVRGTRARSVAQGLVPSKTEIANTAMVVVFLRREVLPYAGRRMAGSSHYDENMDTWPKTMQSSTHTRRGRPWSARPGFD